MASLPGVSGCERANRTKPFPDRHQRILDRRGRATELLQPLSVAERPESMHAVTPDGRVWSGGQAARVILAELPGGRILSSIAATFPGATEWLYRLVARHRDRIGRLLGQRVCSVDPSAMQR